MEQIADREYLTKEEAQAFVGKNAAYYLEQWKDHPDTSYKGWNWAATFFRVEWMVYRRMYRETALLFGGLVLLSVLLSLLGLDFLGDLAAFGFQLSIGGFGNALYRRKALRTLRQTHGMTPQQRLEALENKGGTSVLAVVVLAALELLLAFL